MSIIEFIYEYHEKVRNLIHPEIPAQQLSILYLVAKQPGVTHTEIGRELDMPQGTVSRNVTKLSFRLIEDRQGRYQKYGYGLVENRSDYKTDPRRNAVYLTKEGEKVIAELTKAAKQGMQKFREGEIT